MITTQILTQNNQDTIRKTLESISCLDSRILIGDLNSTDDTLKICKEFGCEIFNLNFESRSESREYIFSKSKSNINFWIEPWEFLYSNKNSIINFDGNQGYVRILENGIINWDIRIWKKASFINPIYEHIKEENAKTTQLIICCSKSKFVNYGNRIQKWKVEDPFNPDPFYFNCFYLLSQGLHKEFIKEADNYLFLEKSNNQSSLLIRYYYAYIYLTKLNLIKPVLQNLNICISKKPLMAEFWCLMADVYYFKLNRYDIAKEFYENAKILGSKRLSDETFPMDISKYSKYPNKMIESCDYLFKK